MKGKTSNLEIERFFFCKFRYDIFSWIFLLNDNDDLSNLLFWSHVFMNINWSHLRSVTTFSHQTKQMSWEILNATAITLIQLQRMIELVMCTHTGYLKQTDLQQHFRWYNIAVVICFCKYFVKLWQWCTMIWEFVMICIQCYFKLIDIYISDYLHSWLFYILPTSPDNKKAFRLTSPKFQRKSKNRKVSQHCSMLFHCSYENLSNY